MWLVAQTITIIQQDSLETQERLDLSVEVLIVCLGCLLAPVSSRTLGHLIDWLTAEPDGQHCIQRDLATEHAPGAGMTRGVVKAGV